MYRLTLLLMLGLSAGVVSAQTKVSPQQGGTGIDSSHSTGCPNLSGGVWTIGSCGGGGGGGIPSGTTNQMLYYAAPGTTVSPLTLGTNLSISGGIINASSTASTAWSSLTSGTSSGQVFLIGTGGTLAPTAGGLITATSAPFTGLTGNLGTTQGPSSLTGLILDTAGTLSAITGAAAGDLAYYNGSTWAKFAGNSSGTQVLSENSSGTPSWTAFGTGNVNTGTSNTYTTGIQSMTAATGLVIPSVATTTTTNGTLGYNTTRGQYEGYAGGSIWVFPWVAVGGGTPTQCAYWVSAYNLGSQACGAGTGTVSSGTGTHFTWYASTGTTVSANANLTEASNALVYAGSSGLSLTGGGSVGGFFDFTQGTAQTGTASHSKMWADTTAGNLQMINGTGSQQKVTGTVFAGTKALATGSITSTACHSDTLTATGVASTDAIAWNSNASLSAVTGYIPATTGGLTINVYPTTNTINIDVCNWSTASITPGAVTLNVVVTR